MTSPLLKSALGEGHKLPPRGAPPGRAPGGPRGAIDFSPLPWNHYFTDSQEVKFPDYCDSSFRVYSCGVADSQLMVVLLHGGGYNGLTWALFATELTKRVSVDCLAIDLRGHGDTHTSNDTDLSAPTMCEDIGRVVNHQREMRKQKGINTAGVVLLGHSMGGALAVRVASLKLIENIAGVVVIDVVEGTAIEALGSMQTFLKSRPQAFPSVDAAISWSIKSGQTRNINAARISMPGQIVEETTTSRGSEVPSTGNNMPPPPAKHANLGGISEEAEEEESAGTTGKPSEVEPPKETTPQVPAKKWVWRIDLSQTEPFWPGWFENLSKLFLSLTCPRVLVLAGMDRLDKDLTVGQMRGQFQLQVIEKCGHSVHEDAPEKLADVIASFLVRNKLTTAVGNFTPSFPCC